MIVADPLEETDALKAAWRWADTLRDEQQAAVSLRKRGESAQALQILFGAEYEGELASKV
jgi:hypothetical protein